MTTASERVRAIDFSALQGIDLKPALTDLLAGKPAERILDKVLRKRDAPQRHAIAEALFGVGLWRRRLRVQAKSDEPLALLDALIHMGPDPEDFADRHSLPDWLALEIQRTPGPEALADALNLPGPICLRARDDRHALAVKLIEEHVWTRMGSHASKSLIVTSMRPNLLGLEAWREGQFEVQDEGSQMLGELVEAKPGDSVIDLCAGAGGKTLQLASLGATVHACDIDLDKLERLRRRAEHARLSGIVIHGERPPGDLRADAVLVDAPCSELGALRRGPDLRWRLDPSSFEALPHLQLGILEKGAAHVRPAGRLVFATCTFREEENENLARRFEQRHPDFERIGEPFHCWPHVEGTDAFFAAVWLKK